MTRITARATPLPTAEAGPAVTAVAVLTAVGCLGFALVNVVSEVTDRFAEGSYAEYASAFAVMNWLVVGLKLLGEAVALLSVTRHQRLVSPSGMTLLLWGAFATLAAYALGSVVQAVGMATGLTGSAAQIDMAGVAYVLGSLGFAAGFGVLAISYSRRHGFRRRAVAGGVLGAPALLGLLLLAVPALLAVAGLMPAP
jgi:hypothetical protein